MFVHSVEYLLAEHETAWNECNLGFRTLSVQAGQHMDPSVRGGNALEEIERYQL